MRNFGSLKVVAVILIALLIACDAQSRISGHVYDPDDRPVANATVRFEVIDCGHPEIYVREMQTDASGRFFLWVPHGPFNVGLRLSVSKEGHIPFVKDLTANEASKMRDENYELKVNLQEGIDR